MIDTGIKWWNMSALPRITTFFVIEGEGVVPAECTARIGLEATSSRAESVRRETLVPSGEPHILPPYWRLELTKEALDSTDDGLRNLLERLCPRREQVRELLRETGWKAMFGTTVTITEARPVYELSGDTIQRLAFFEAEYTLDVFDYSE